MAMALSGGGDSDNSTGNHGLAAASWPARSTDQKPIFDVQKSWREGADLTAHD